MLVEGGESGADYEEDGPDMMNKPTLVFSAVILQSGDFHG
jgi:hypothetical protein